MLTGTVSLLRRLVGFEPGPALDATPGESDRRASERFLTNLEITCRPANAGPEVRLTGRIRNISLGGVRLVVDHRFDPGDLLTIELPRTDGRSTQSVLACVVHVSPMPGGHWSLGCNFSCELTDDDLAAFGARRQRTAAQDDQRAWQRFACDLRATCQTVVERERDPWPVQVLNISANGIGLLSNVSIPTGGLLSVEMQGRQSKAPLTVLACVVHVTPRGSDWALGCNFIRELKQQELEALDS